ncbi:hypothetical protein HDU81_002122 [Chytriomyces hyalinus]|nr:hypothetical protein HDU81_002122 [Chytriomyces hyalinus]
MTILHTAEHNRLITEYGNCPGFYVARVTQAGPYARPGDFVKVGQTSTSLKRHVDCHSKDFRTFNLVIFVPSTLSGQIERAFRVNPLVCQNRVTGGFRTRQSNHSKILQLSANFPLSVIERLVNAILEQPGMGVVEVEPEMLQHPGVGVVDNDYFLQWVMQRVVPTPGTHIHNKTAREDYYRWCTNNNIFDVLTKREFGLRMNSRFPLVNVRNLPAPPSCSWHTPTPDWLTKVTNPLKTATSNDLMRSVIETSRATIEEQNQEIQMLRSQLEDTYAQIDGSSPVGSKYMSSAGNALTDLFGDLWNRITPKVQAVNVDLVMKLYHFVSEIGEGKRKRDGTSCEQNEVDVRETARELSLSLSQLRMMRDMAIQTHKIQRDIAKEINDPLKEKLHAESLELLKEQEQQIERLEREECEKVEKRIKALVTGEDANQTSFVVEQDLQFKRYIEPRVAFFIVWLEMRHGYS